MIAGALGSGTEVTARSTSATSDEGMPQRWPPTSKTRNSPERSGAVSLGCRAFRILRVTSAGA
jgi:hypothetical protein